MRKTWGYRNPIIKWTIDYYRKDKRHGPLNPIKRSGYLNRLFNEEEKRHRK